MPSFDINIFGGMNQSDQPKSLINRAFSESSGGFSQYAPAESPDLKNMDFDQLGIKSRKGSVIEEDLSSIMVGGEDLIRGVEWINVISTETSEIIVGTKSIYVREVGVWSRINDSTGSPYSHAADVSKCTFAMTDGHLFIGLDGDNHIQVYKEGQDLDPELDNGNLYEESFSATTHTIDGVWGTGTYLLATVHNRLCFSDGNTYLEATPQAHTASSGIWKLSAGVFFQATGIINAMWSFVPEQTDSLNEYLYIGSTTGIEVLTGFSASDKLIKIEGSKSPMNHQCFCKTKNWVIYLTNDKNIYGVNGSNIINLGRRLRTPNGGGILNSMNTTRSIVTSFAIYNPKKEQAQFYISTNLTKFNDRCIILDFQLGEPLLNEPQSNFEQRVRLIPWEFKKGETEDWFTGAYVQREEVRALLRNGKIFNQEKKNADLSFNQNIVGVTLVSGSPVYLTINSHGISTGDNVKITGVNGTTELNGNTFVATSIDSNMISLNDTNSDDFTAWVSGGVVQSGSEIESYWDSPDFDAGSFSVYLKQWFELEMRTEPLGAWDVKLSTFLDRASSPSKENLFLQASTIENVFGVAKFSKSKFSDERAVKKKDRVLTRSESIKHRISTNSASSPFNLFGLSQSYKIGRSIIS